MNEYLISQLEGEALERAITTVINALARIGCDISSSTTNRLREQAYEIASALEVRFDQYGNSDPSHKKGDF